MVAEDGKDDLEGTSPDSQPAPGLLESGVELMSTTIPHATPNLNVKMRKIAFDLQNASEICSIVDIDSTERQKMADDIEMRMKEAQNEAILDYQQSRSKRVNTPAVAGGTQGNIAVLSVDPMTRKPENQFARDLHEHKKDAPSRIVSFFKEKSNHQ